MSTFGLEAILIGNIINGIGLAIISYKRIWATNHNCLIFGTDIFQLTFLIVGLTIAGLQTGKEMLVSHWTFSSVVVQHLRERVSIGLHIRIQTQNLRLRWAIDGHSHSDGNEKCGEHDSKFHFYFDIYI